MVAVVRPDEASAVVAGWLTHPAGAVALGATGRKWIESRTWSHQPLCDAVLPPSTL